MHFYSHWTNVCQFHNFSDVDEVTEQLDHLPGIPVTSDIRRTDIPVGASVLIRHGATYLAAIIDKKFVDDKTGALMYSGLEFSIPKAGKWYSERTGFSGVEHSPYGFPASDIVSELTEGWKAVDSAGRPKDRKGRHYVQFPELLRCRRFLTSGIEVKEVEEKKEGNTSEDNGNNVSHST